jgi:hypothetical protein
MSNIPPTKEEAERQIAELQRHIESLKPKPIPIPDDVKVGDAVVLNNGERRKITTVYAERDDPRIHIAYDSNLGPEDLCVVSMRTGRSWGMCYYDLYVVAIERKPAPKYRVWEMDEVPLGWMIRRVGGTNAWIIATVSPKYFGLHGLSGLGLVSRENFLQYEVAPPGPIKDAKWQPAGVLVEGG